VQGRERRWNPIETPVPAHFFNKVRLAPDIDPEGGDGHLPAVSRRRWPEAESLQDAHDFRIGDAIAQELSQARL
jgi:hypothetical protein